ARVRGTGAARADAAALDSARDGAGAVAHTVESGGTRTPAVHPRSDDSRPRRRAVLAYVGQVPSGADEARGTATAPPPRPDASVACARDPQPARIAQGKCTAPG